MRFGFYSVLEVYPQGEQFSLKCPYCMLDSQLLFRDQATVP